MGVRRGGRGSRTTWFRSNTMILRTLEEHGPNEQNGSHEQDQSAKGDSEVEYDYPRFDPGKVGKVSSSPPGHPGNLGNPGNPPVSNDYYDNDPGPSKRNQPKKAKKMPPKKGKPENVSREDVEASVQNESDHDLTNSYTAILPTTTQNVAYGRVSS